MKKVTFSLGQPSGRPTIRPTLPPLDLAAATPKGTTVQTARLERSSSSTSSSDGSAPVVHLTIPQNPRITQRPKPLLSPQRARTRAVRLQAETMPQEAGTPATLEKKVPDATSKKTRKVKKSRLQEARRASLEDLNKLRERLAGGVSSGRKKGDDKKLAKLVGRTASRLADLAADPALSLSDLMEAARETLSGKAVNLSPAQAARLGQSFVQEAQRRAAALDSPEAGRRLLALALQISVEAMGERAGGHLAAAGAEVRKDLQPLVFAQIEATTGQEVAHEKQQSTLGDFFRGNSARSASTQAFLLSTAKDLGGFRTRLAELFTGVAVPVDASDPAKASVIEGQLDQLDKDLLNGLLHQVVGLLEVELESAPAAWRAVAQAQVDAITKHFDAPQQKKAAVRKAFIDTCILRFLVGSLMGIAADEQASSIHRAVAKWVSRRLQAAANGTAEADQEVAQRLANLGSAFMGFDLSQAADEERPAPLEQALEGLERAMEDLELQPGDQ